MCNPEVYIPCDFEVSHALGNKTILLYSGHIPFELNSDYHLWISYKKDIDLCFRSKIVNKLLAKLRKLMIVCCENLYHA